jgi:hypothetical protein
LLDDSSNEFRDSAAFQVVLDCIDQLALGFVKQFAFSNSGVVLVAQGKQPAFVDAMLVDCIDVENSSSCFNSWVHVGSLNGVIKGDPAAIGVADRQSNRPVTNDTLFRIGSVSKIFVSLAVIKLVEDGRMKLSEPIRRLAPEAGVINRWESTHPVELVHVLEHTAGFDDIHIRDYAFNDPNVTTLGGIEFNSTSRITRWPPGTRMAYSNMGPAVAALAVEKVTGERFEDYVSREVFAPLGISTATYFYNCPLYYQGLVADKANAQTSRVDR